MPTLPPRLFHLAEARNWPLIRRDGLLCAAALLAAPGVPAADRERLGRRHRPAAAVLPTGPALRDRAPMPPAALARCLVGLTPAEWYARVNRHVFFWPDADRLRRFRLVYPDRPQVLLVVDTAALVAAHGGRAYVTPINVGNARRRPARRGAATFVAYADWQATGWATAAAALGTRPRPPRHPPAEVAVTGAVPDVLSLLVEAVDLPAGTPAP